MLFLTYSISPLKPNFFFSPTKLAISHSVMIDRRLEATIDSVDHVLTGQGFDPVGVVAVVLHIPEQAVTPETPALPPRPLDHLVRLVRVVLTPISNKYIVQKLKFLKIQKIVYDYAEVQHTDNN